MSGLWRGCEDLDDLADLFEQGAADGTPVRESSGRTRGVAVEQGAVWVALAG
jgi:hypothetical protein